MNVLYRVDAATILPIHRSYERCIGNIQDAIVVRHHQDSTPLLSIQALR